MSLINEYKKNTIFKYLQLDDYMFIEKVLFNENLFVTGTNRYLNSNIDYKILKNSYKYNNSKFDIFMSKREKKDFCNINDKIILKKLIKCHKLHIYYVINNKLNNEEDILECFEYYIKITGKYSLNTVFDVIVKNKYTKIIDYIFENNLIPKNNCYGYYFTKSHYYDYFFKLVKIDKLFINRNLIINVCGNGLLDIFKYLIDNNKIDNKYIRIIRYTIINNHIDCLKYLMESKNNKKYLEYLKNESLLVNLGKEINCDCLFYLAKNNFEFSNQFYIRLFDSQHFRNINIKINNKSNIKKFIYQLIVYGYNKNPNILTSGLLQKALSSGNIELVKFLFEKNCPHNGNELYSSVISGNYELIKILHFDYDYNLKDQKCINYLKNILSKKYYINDIERENYQKCYEFISKNV